jgi:Zn-dependent protease
MNQEQLTLLPLWYVAFLLSLTCHEAAHALAAKWGGDPTAYHAGQVTLNPLPHIRREPFGTVLVPLLTFLMGGSMLGWGSAPYDPFWEHRYPRRAAAMALAGPCANFALVVVVGLAIHAGAAAGFFALPQPFEMTRVVLAASPAAEGAAMFLNILFLLNVLLGVFNLFPVAPLDGHSAIGLLLPEHVFARWIEFIRQPMPSLIGLLLAWRLFDTAFWPVFRVARWLMVGEAGLL